MNPTNSAARSVVVQVRSVIGEIADHFPPVWKGGRRNGMHVCLSATFARLYYQGWVSEGFDARTCSFQSQGRAPRGHECGSNEDVIMDVVFHGHGVGINTVWACGWCKQVHQSHITNGHIRRISDAIYVKPASMTKSMSRPGTWLQPHVNVYQQVHEHQ
jgi:hypothetical protein